MARTFHDLVRPRGQVVKVPAQAAPAASVLSYVSRRHVVGRPRVRRGHRRHLAQLPVELDVGLRRGHVGDAGPPGDPAAYGRGLAEQREEVHHLVVDGREHLLGQADARHDRHQPVRTHLAAHRQREAPEPDVVTTPVRRGSRAAAEDVTVEDHEAGSPTQVVADRRLAGRRGAGDHQHGPRLAHPATVDHRTCGGGGPGSAGSRATTAARARLRRPASPGSARRPGRRAPRRP